MPNQEKRKRVPSNENVLSTSTQQAKRSKILDFREEGHPSLGTSCVQFATATRPMELNFPQAPKNSESELAARVSEAFGAAAGRPFAKENLERAKRWLHFRGLVISETTTGSEATLAQQIVQHLRHEIPHGFRLYTLDGNPIIPKGLLLLVAIAHYYAIRIVIFSTRCKPIEITPNEFSYTVALLRHQDSILSVGGWYPLELAKNWVERTPSVHMTPTPLMASPAAVKRPQGAAPKRKLPANYASISDDTLKDLLRIVMKERLQNDYEKEMKQNPTLKKLDDFKKTNINQTSPPRGYVQSVLKRLGETIDTSNMNGLGLSKCLGRMKDPSTMQIWKEVMEEYLAAISKNPNICTPSQ
ncbi:9443_t:CDS:2, partial [Paraglomus occultum]